MVIARTKQRRLKASAERIKEALQLEAIGFIVQEILLKIEPPAVIIKGFNAGRFITDDKPVLAAVFEPS